MAIVVTHKKLATAPDQPDAEINKGEWNDTHDVEIESLADVPGLPEELDNKLDVDGGNASTDIDIGGYGLTASKLTATITYNGTSYIQPFGGNLTINTAEGNDTFDYIGSYITISDTHATSGVIEDGSIGRYCYVANFTRTANSSVDWQDGGELMTGYSMNMTRGGVFTGEGHSVEMVGYNLIMNNEVSYNNPSGNYTQNMYGSKMIVQSTGSVTAGSVTKNVFGQYYAFSVGGEIAATAIYANYLASMGGADVMYGLYHLPDVLNYLEGKLGLGTPDPTAKIDINSDIFRVRVNKTPASATASGNKGDFCWDTNYLYVCVATNTWKRTALSTW